MSIRDCLRRKELLFAALFVLFVIAFVHSASIGHCFLVWGPRSVYYPPCVQSYEAAGWHLPQYLTLFAMLPLALTCTAASIPENWARAFGAVYAMILIYVCFRMDPNIALFGYSDVLACFGYASPPPIRLHPVYILAFVLIMFVAWRNLPPRLLRLQMLIPAVLSYGIPIADGKTPVKFTVDRKTVG